MSEHNMFPLIEPKSLAEMTWPEVHDLLERTRTVLVTVGSMEAHGYHLPLATDTMCGTALVKRVAGTLEARGIIVAPGPTIPFGISPYFMDFPGTVTLKSRTLLAVISDVCESLYAHGFRIFYLILAHGGNYAAMQVAAQDLAVALEGSHVVVVNWLPHLAEKNPSYARSERISEESHAGEVETARMLVTAPDLVQLDCAQEYYFESPLRGSVQIPHNYSPTGGGSVFRPMSHAKKEYTEIAVRGNPHLATKETGDRSYTIICDWVSSIIEQDLLVRFEEPGKGSPRCAPTDQRADAR